MDTPFAIFEFGTRSGDFKERMFKQRASNLKVKKPFISMEQKILACVTLENKRIFIF